MTRQFNYETIRARYKGKWFSLGYLRKPYILQISYGGYWKGKPMHCWIKRIDGNGLCPYESKESFEKNWDVL